MNDDIKVKPDQPRPPVGPDDTIPFEKEPKPNASS